MFKSLVSTIIVAMTMLAPSAEATPDPAAVFCKTMSGRSVTATLRNGDELGLCYLPHRRIVEEWTLYRMFNGKKPSAARNPFR